MNFIDASLIPATVLEKGYNPYLVLLSVVIAVLACFTAFGTTERVYFCRTRSEKFLWVLFGAFSMGSGVWAMHFIGSLALQLPIAVSYNLFITCISIIPAILASSVVLWMMSQARCQTDTCLKRLLLSGILLGSGIGVMHYTGMEAMELNATMLYINSVFILSIIVAVVLATIALVIQQQVTQSEKYQFINRKQALGALVMGFAVSGMHYTAIYAVEFVPLKENADHLLKGVNSSVLSAIISAVVFLILTVALVVPHMLRFRQMAQQLQKNEEDLKIAAIAFQTHEAIMVTDADSNILRINNAFTRIMGYTEQEVINRNPRMLASGRHESVFYKNFWKKLEESGKWSGEIWNRRKNGEVFPEWQSVSAVQNDDGDITHYISFFSDISEFKSAEKEIEQLAFYDSLTELPNRRLLHERLEHELNIAARTRQSAVLFFLDLDQFKHINDSLGHSVGDLLLIETANRLQALIRSSDTAARLGGDEFIVLLGAEKKSQQALLRQANVVAEKIIEAISQPYSINEHELFISTSIGITLLTGTEESPEELLKRADTAMYQAKEAGRNTFRFYRQSMQEAADSRLCIERQLRTAIENDEFSVLYQPQLSDKNKVVGAEALIRWNNDTVGFVPPNEFISIAEETGLIIPIGQWVVKTVCKQVKSIEQDGLDISHIAINISAKQFCQHDFVPMLIDCVAAEGVAPSKIMLEITEGVFLGNLEEAIEKMNLLKTSGFSFSIDDFGTGYSSLTYLKRLPFDQLKIDQSFVRGLVNNQTDAAIVKAIVVMAKSMGLNLIAEGVETERHLSFLSNYGCYHFQGYYFSRPLPEQQLHAFIREHCGGVPAEAVNYG